MEGGGALLSARRSISPREKRRPLGGGGSAPARCHRPWAGAAGRPVTRLRAAPRSTAPPMASDDRNPLYEEYEAEFNTQREEMDALGIGASFKPLISYENWSRYRPSKRTFIVGHARRDSKIAIDRAKGQLPLTEPRRLLRRRPPRPRLAALKPGPRCATARTPARQCSRR